MTIKQAIKILSMKNPSTPHDALVKCGFSLKLVGEGCFRDTFRVLDTPLVIKFPCKEYGRRSYNKNLKHALQEYDAWKHIKESTNELRLFRKYLPRVHYFNPVTGVIVMTEYNTKAAYKRTRMIAALRNRLYKSLNACSTDLYEGNVGVDKRGNLKIIDLGLLVYRKKC